MQLIGQNVHRSDKSRNCLFTIGQLVISKVCSVLKHWLPFRLSRSHWANICTPYHKKFQIYDEDNTTDFATLHIGWSQTHIAYAPENSVLRVWVLRGQDCLVARVTPTNGIAASEEAWSGDTLAYKASITSCHQAARAQYIKQKTSCQWGCKPS